MLCISYLSKTPIKETSFSFFTHSSSFLTQTHYLKLKNPLQFTKNPPFSISISSKKNPVFFTKASASDNSESDPETENETEAPTVEDEWLSKLPDKKNPLYAHSLPCIEAWLRSLGFYQSKEDKAVWFVDKPGWRAQLSLDITDLYIRYLKNGPGNLEKDMERRFSYALSREDIENAVLGGP